ncbi:hypothetical protein I2I11_14440 [Pontibacter sp. 172403-2]|uniref:hypothetical protein n=1 Tax=Pontibacter rufus TaxID=2791028 RepID=UPI0018AF5B64|nr:hypothetical protein [Pontibacter sp. 172403-2]MBF9254499.1 hypothetical protein [Pontibacter sp. 172403-2]
MSTNNISDEELDDLFRKAAGNFEPAFDPDAWHGMEQKLDRVQERVRQKWLKRFFPLLLLVLIVSFPIILKRTQSPQSVINSQEAITPETQQKSITANTETAEKTFRNIKPEQAQVAPQKAMESKQAPVAEAAAPKSEKKKTAGRSARAEKNNLQQLPATVLLPDTTAGVVELQPQPEERQQQMTLAPADTQKTAADALALQQVYPKSGEAAAADSVEKVVSDTPVTAMADSSRLSEKKKRTFLSSIGIALVVAPDFTMVKFRNPGAISTNAGISISIPITRRLSLVSGAVWADKVYGALPRDYTPSDDYWDGKKLPTTIDAVCKVLDIPLNLEWQLLEHGHSTAAIQAGLSSYIMLDEKYTYNYKGSGYYPYQKTWEPAGQNRHWFKVQNLAASYTYKVSPAFSLGVAPFVKIPLSGIGAGHVKLSSAGVFLSAGYRFELK